MAPTTSGRESSGISAYLVRKSAARERIVEAVCPILNLLRSPSTVHASLRLQPDSGVQR